jgi:hypothetical protein
LFVFGERRSDVRKTSTCRKKKKEKERKTRREEQEKKLVCFGVFGRDDNGRGRCVHASGASAGPRDVAADSVSDGYR